MTTTTSSYRAETTHNLAATLNGQGYGQGYGQDEINCLVAGLELGVGVHVTERVYVHPNRSASCSSCAKNGASSACKWVDNGVTWVRMCGYDFVGEFVWEHPVVWSYSGPP